MYRIHAKLPPRTKIMFIETFQLLFTVVAIEAALILILGFGTPVRVVVVKLLDLLKQGRGPLVTKTVAATMLVLFGSVLFSTIQINTRVSESGGVANPTDQVMFANRLLEAFLMGNKKKNTISFHTSFLSVFLIYIFNWFLFNLVCEKGTVLFLAMVIDRMHYYTRELQITRKNLEVAIKKTKTAA